MLTIIIIFSVAIVLLLLAYFMKDGKEEKPVTKKTDENTIVVNIRLDSDFVKPEPRTELYSIDPPLYPQDLVPEVIPYLGRVKTKPEWKLTPFPLSHFRDGNIKPVSKGRKKFYHQRVDEEEPFTQAAHRTNKILGDYYATVATYIGFGLTNRDEYITNDKCWYLAHASIAYWSDQFESSLENLNKIIPSDRDHSWYSLFYNTSLKLKRTEEFDAFLKYYINDLDSVIHSEELIQWLRLMKKVDISKARQTVQFVLENLDRIRSAEPAGRIYQYDNAHDFIGYRKEKFIEKMIKMKLLDP